LLSFWTATFCGVEYLLVGCGSVGKKHLSKLIELGGRIHVVDPDENARKYAISQSEEFVKTYKNLIELKRNQTLSEFNLAIIANWGPDHYATFEEIQSFKINALLVEKPIASKLSDISSLQSKIRDSNLKTFSGYHIRFDSGFSRLQNLCSESNFGKPVLISVVGGAKCLATTGIHWLDFGNELLGSKWKNINSRVNTSSLNPRSRDLAFLEGYVQIEFEKNCQLSLNFTNQSFMDTQVTLIWEKAKGILVDGELTIYEPEEKIDNARPITRTVFFNKISEKIPFFKDGFENLYEIVQSPQSTQMENLFTANKMLLFALISSETMKTIFADEKIEAKYQVHDWRIS